MIIIVTTPSLIVDGVLKKVWNEREGREKKNTQFCGWRCDAAVSTGLWNESNKIYLQENNQSCKSKYLSKLICTFVCYLII